MPDFRRFLATVAKPKRHCPTLGEVILSSRCGEERGVRIACTADCEFNPFAPRNYGSFLDLEEKVLIKALQRYRQEVGPLVFERMMERGRGSGEGKSQEPILRFLFLQPLPDGRRLAECWEADGWSGLSHDERRLFQSMARRRLAVLEVRRQLGDETLEVVDLLDEVPAPLVLADRALTGQWLRFQTILAWIYEAPHFHRPRGTVLHFEGVGSASPLESLAAIVAHLGGPASLVEAREWMGDHLEEIQASLTASTSAFHLATLKAVDACHRRALYRWAGDGDLERLERKFRGVPGFEIASPDADSRGNGWMLRWDVVERAPEASAPMELPWSEQTNPGEEESLLGQVLAGPQGVEVNTFGTKRYEALKERVERVVGPLMVFDSESIEDKASKLLEAQESKYDSTLVPPSLIGTVPTIELKGFRGPASGDQAGGRLSALLEHQYRGYADRPLPALDDLTPREAAADPEWRPRLIRLMKSNMYSLDRQMATEGGSYDLTPLVRELGLFEIDVPPPPARDPETEDGDGWHDVGSDDVGLDEEEAEDGYFSPADWRYDPSEGEHPAPCLILDEREVEARLTRLAERGKGADDDWLRRVMVEWEDLGEVVEPLDEDWSDQDSLLFRVQMIKVAYLMHPERPPGLRMRPGRLWHFFKSERERLVRLITDGTSPVTVEHLVGDSSQRAVLEQAIVFLLKRTLVPRGRQGRNKKEPPLDQGVMLQMACMVRALVRELSHWPVG